MGKGVSQREFARLDGCSPTLVRQGLEKGKLIAFADGTIDPALAGTPWRQTAQGGTQLGSYAQAQCKKENYLALLRQLEFEVKSEQLIEAGGVEAEMFDMAREFRDGLMTWPSRVAPLIAAELRIDQVKLTVLLEKHVREYLAKLREPRLRGARPGNGAGGVVPRPGAGTGSDGQRMG